MAIVAISVPETISPVRVSPTTSRAPGIRRSLSRAQNRSPRRARLARRSGEARASAEAPPEVGPTPYKSAEARPWPNQPQPPVPDTPAAPATGSAAPPAEPPPAEPPISGEPDTSSPYVKGSNPHTISDEQAARIAANERSNEIDKLTAHHVDDLKKSEDFFRSHGDPESAEMVGDAIKRKAYNDQLDQHANRSLEDLRNSEAAARAAGDNQTADVLRDAATRKMQMPPMSPEEQALAVNKMANDPGLVDKESYQYYQRQWQARGRPDIADMYKQAWAQKSAMANRRRFLRSADRRWWFWWPSHSAAARPAAGFPAHLHADRSTLATRHRHGNRNGSAVHAHRDAACISGRVWSPA